MDTFLQELGLEPPSGLSITTILLVGALVYIGVNLALENF